MAEPTARAYTVEEQDKHEAEAALDKMLKPLMTEQNRYMTGDGTIGNPVRGAVSEQLAAEKPVEPAKPDEQPNAYETEYAAATDAQNKAQVAAKHEDWQKAYGNAQNVIGEGRARETTLLQRAEAAEARVTQVPQNVQQPQQNPYQAFDNFQVVQPQNEYDDQATRINEAFRGYTMQLGQALEQRYGATINQLTQTIEGIKRMPQNYAVDAATEATLVNELNLGNLPEWQQKSIVQRIVGQQTSSNTRMTTPIQTAPEKAVQRAVNYVEPSNATASVQSPETAQLRMQREYEDARAKETDPLKKNKAGRDVLLKYGVQQVDDHRRLPI